MWGRANRVREEGEVCVVPALLPQHICLCVCSFLNSRRFSHLPPCLLVHGHLIDGWCCRFGPDTDPARRLSEAINFVRLRSCDRQTAGEGPWFNRL